MAKQLQKAWYQSKTIQGVFISTLGYIATITELPLLEGEIESIVTLILTLVGMGYTIYGRVATNGEEITL